MAHAALGVLAAGLIAVCTVPFAHAQDRADTKTPCLRIGSAFGGKHTVDDMIESNLRDVLATLDICIDVVSGPPKRLTEELLRGDLDGELVRVRAYQMVAGDAALLIDEPVMEIYGDLVLQADIEPESAPLSDLSIGILRGVKWHDAASKGARSAVIANDMEQLVSMLLNRRVDGILVGQLLRQDYPELAHLPSRVAYSDTGHFVLHKSHADLVKPITEAFKAFRHRGCSFVKPGGGSTCSSTGEAEEREDEEYSASLPPLHLGFPDKLAGSAAGAGPAFRMGEA